MNQDQFLESLWSDVIEDADGRVDPADAASDAGSVPCSATRSLRRIARDARHRAVFDWCVSFDDAGLPPASWLLPRNRWRWERLVDEDLSAFLLDDTVEHPAPDAPFAEAYEAMDHLSAGGVPHEAIRSVIRRSRRAALDAVLAALRRHTFGPDDLAGLHESLGSAHPRDCEGSSRPRPEGSGAPSAQATGSASPAPIRTVRRSHDLAFSPDGSRIVAAQGGVITDVGSGEALATCRLLANTSRVAWSPDGRWIAATSTSGKIALCDALSGARRYVMEMSCEGVGAMFSPDGARVYAGDWNGVVFAWDVASGREVRRRELPGAMVVSVRWARGQDALDVVAWGRSEPTLLLTLPGTLGAVERRIELPHGTSDVLWDPDGGRALIVGCGWIARMDRVGAVTERRELRGAAALGRSPDGRWIAVTHAGGFRIGPTADLGLGSEVALRYPSHAASFSPDCRRVAFATWGVGEVWELGQLLGA